MENNIISDEQLQELKQKHGKVYVIEFNPQFEGDAENQSINPDYDPDYPTCDFAFKKMDFDIAAASGAMLQQKPLQALKLQMESTLVFGYKELLKDPLVMGSLSAPFNHFNKARTAKIKKN